MSVYERNNNWFLKNPTLKFEIIVCEAIEFWLEYLLNIYPRSIPFLFIHSAIGQFAHG